MPENFSFVEFNKKFKTLNIDASDEEISMCTYGLIVDFNGEFPIKFKSLKKAFQSEGIKFISKLNGSWLIYIYDKINETKYIATDQYSDQSIYYSQQNGVINVSNSIWNLISEVDWSELKLSENACSQMLHFGQCFNDYTLFENIKKLKAGHFLKITNEQHLTVKKYHQFEIQDIDIDKQSIFRELDRLFDQAIHRQFKPDGILNYNKSTCFLSAGMDSRNTVLTAQKLGYNLEAISFGTVDSFDIEIAKNICTLFGIEHHVYHFNFSNPENSILNAVELSDGLTSLQHVLDTFNNGKSIDLTQSGVIHTGQIGAIIGSRPPTSQTQLGLPKSKEFSENRKMDEYINAIYEKSFNGDLIGNKISKHYSITLSPYLDIDFANFAMGLNTELKKGRKLYLEWIINSKPEQAKFPWSSTGIDLKSSYRLKHGQGFSNKLYRKFKKQMSIAPLKNWNEFIKEKALRESIDKTLEQGKMRCNELGQSNINLLYDNYNHKKPVIKDLRMCTIYGALIVASSKMKSH